MRILLVSPGNNHKYGGGFYYAFHRRLMNGFIRNGHFVYQFSDRDTADYALGMRQLGKWLANKRLIEIASELKPTLLILQQSHMITPETARRVRDVAPAVKIAAISIDDISDPTPAAQFRYLLEEADIGFATTGGQTLKGFSGLRPMAFIPNPVDISIDTKSAGDANVHDYDLIFAGHQPIIDPRWAFIEEVANKLPAAVRCGVFGKHQQRQLSGAAYIEALGASKIGLNLNRRDGDLYASDRMAQLLGNGLLLATHRASGYSEVFSEDEMLFFTNSDDLAAGIERVLGAGEPWRAMAHAGRRKAIATMSETRVARFIVDAMQGASLPSNWAFPNHVFGFTQNASEPAAIS